jgi:hypothetical protein
MSTPETEKAPTWHGDAFSVIEDALLGIGSRGIIRPGRRSAGDSLRSVQRWAFASVSSGRALPAIAQRFPILF